ncbi:FUN14 domain-containing protein 1 isoform X1 [Brachyistius frenatus]|uniref:FUN14 domain-containing protein 1 isoform X1 n=1 Tax=Brachyistius frenatus TaxID=100188 RepID=UPI0037E7EFA2
MCEAGDQTGRTRRRVASSFTLTVKIAANDADVQTAEDRAASSKMANRDKELEEEIYDKVVDLTEYAKRQRWWNRLFGKNSGPVAEKYSVATQLAIGGASGWCAGYLFQKVGKVAATSVGGGLLLLQIANNSGYIQVDWKRVEKDVNKAKKQLKKGTDKAGPELNTLVDKSTEFVKKNIVVTSGFIGGFLLGLVS